VRRFILNTEKTPFPENTLKPGFQVAISPPYTQVLYKNNIRAVNNMELLTP
jgi:hypothetical protein